MKLKINIPQNFLSEEIRCGVKVTKSIKELWAVEIDLLKELDRVCTKYNIIYSVSGGTLLGAVRHRGFIPWDDDIDVMMMRDQYERLCSVAESEFVSPYFFQTEKTDPGCMRRFARLRNIDTTGIIKWELPMRPTFNQGIFIDIFPLDAVVPEKNKYEKQCIIDKVYLKLFSLANSIERNSYPYSSVSFLREIKRYLNCIVGPLFKKIGVCQYIYAKLLENYQLYNSCDTEYVSLLSFQIRNLAWMVQRSSLMNIEYVPFEFIQVPIIKDFDEHLRRKYGEYMVPQKIPNFHGELIYDVNQSFKEFYKKFGQPCLN